MSENNFGIPSTESINGVEGLLKMPSTVWEDESFSDALRSF